MNGGLFAGSIEILNFTPDIKELLFDEASSGFNWSGIPPTIFGAVFESTLNPETRRLGDLPLGNDKIFVDFAGCVTEGNEPIGRSTRLTLEKQNIPLDEQKEIVRNLEDLFGLEQRMKELAGKNFGAC